MTTYHLTGSDTTEDYWVLFGDVNDEYIVRSYGLSDTISISRSKVDIDAGDDHDDVTFFGQGVAKLGNGDDSASVGAQRGDSQVYGDAGDDSIFVYMYAAVGSITADGGVGNDYFTTSTGGDAVINGGAGFDMIGVGTAGGAILGKTLISIEGQYGSSSADAMNCWGTDELAIVSGRSLPLLTELGFTTFRNILIGGGGSDQLNGSSGNDLLIGGTMGVNDAALRAMANYRTGIVGLHFDDIPISDPSDSSPDTLIGGAGNDFLTSGYGADSIAGGSGIDTVCYKGRHSSAGGVEVHLALGSDYGFVSDGDTLTGIENVIGSDAGDNLFGTTGRNIFFGLSGDDWLDGGGGRDLLDGGDGADRLADQDGFDTLRGGDSDDTYHVDFASTRIVETTDGYFNGGVDTVIADLNWTLGANLENLSLVIKNDEFGAQIDGDFNGYGNALDNILTGNRGDNKLDGVTGWDDLYGGDGKDMLYDRDGGDRLEGGAGDDTYFVFANGSFLVETLDLASGGGVDTVRSTIDFSLGANFEVLRLDGTANISGYGNDDANTMTGNSGRNTLNGFGGADSILGNGESDQLQGGAGLDTLRGGWGDDTLYGEADADALFGDEGSDTLDGGAGSDTLRGGRSHDVLLGGADNDTLAGESGNDTLDGGAGADVLTFEDAFGFDKVLNFEDGLDRINLRDLREENGGVPLAFNQLLISQAGTSARIQLDLDRNGVADTIDLDGDGIGDSVRIELVDRSAAILSASDFIL